jgi:hypothetical protein
MKWTPFCTSIQVKDKHIQRRYHAYKQISDCPQGAITFVIENLFWLFSLFGGCCIWATLLLDLYCYMFRGTPCVY